MACSHLKIGVQHMVRIQGYQVGSKAEGDGIAKEHDTLGESMSHTFYNP